MFMFDMFMVYYTFSLNPQKIQSNKFPLGQMLHSISHLNHVCGSCDIFHFWKPPFHCYFYLCPILHVLIGAPNWSFQHFIILASGLHHKSTVREKVFSVAKATLQSQMSVCLSVSPKAKQNPKTA